MYEQKTQESLDPQFRSNTLLLAFASAHVFMFSLVLSAVLGLSLDQAAFVANPPQFTWRFPTFFLTGILCTTTLHLMILPRLTGPGFWPQGWKEWRNRVGPIAPLLIAAVLPSIFQPAAPMMIFVAITITVGVIIGMLPTTLCVSLWAKNRSKGGNEIMKLSSVSIVDLPRGVRNHIEKHTPDLLQLGFRVVGDFRLKQYSPMFGRFFLHQDGDIFAEITYSRTLFLTMRAVCFMSLSPAGHYLESSNMRLFGKNSKVKDFEIQWLPGLSVQETFERHRTRLREVNQGAPRLFAIDELEPLIHYGNKQLYKMLIAQGSTQDNPYESFDESVLLAGQDPPVETRPVTFDTPWDPSTSIGSHST